MSEVTIDQVLTLARRLPPEQWSLLITRLSSERPQQTPLAAKLAAARSQIVASGAPLLDWAGIEAEVAERRGER